jgi:hypothetical protein
MPVWEASLLEADTRWPRNRTESRSLAIVCLLSPLFATIQVAAVSQMVVRDSSDAVLKISMVGARSAAQLRHFHLRHIVAPRWQMERQ